MDVTVCRRVMIADVYKSELTSLSVTVQAWAASSHQTVIVGLPGLMCTCMVLVMVLLILDG
jgi:hypothetical protein